MPLKLSKWRSLSHYLISVTDIESYINTVPPVFGTVYCVLVGKQARARRWEKKCLLKRWSNSCLMVNSRCQYEILQNVFIICCLAASRSAAEHNRMVASSGQRVAIRRLRQCENMYRHIFGFTAAEHVRNLFHYNNNNNIVILHQMRGSSGQ